MATLITSLIGASTTVAGTLSSSAVVVGGYLYQGIGIAFDALLSLGSWGCSCFTFAFSICTGCGHKAFSEALRPVEEWDDSEAKRAGTCICCASCALTCALLLALTASIVFSMTYFWYLEIA